MKVDCSAHAVFCVSIIKTIGPMACVRHVVVVHLRLKFYDVSGPAASTCNHRPVQAGGIKAQQDR